MEDDGGRRLRIAYVTETWLPTINGVVTRLSATVRELHRSGHQVLVIAPSPCDGAVEGVEVRSVPSVGVPFIYGGLPWGLPVPRVRRFLDAFGPDLVHAVSPVVLGWSGVAYARRAGVPLVCSYHTHVARFARFYHLGFAERIAWGIVCRAHRLADLNLVTSQASASELTSRGISRVGLWQRGVDLARFRPRPPSREMRERLDGGNHHRRLLLYVGRLAAEKNLERLLPLTRRDDLHLALVGDGPARRALAATFAGRNVTFAGPLLGDDLLAAYASADLFLFPSTTDTLGLVLLEALASGLPVVASCTPASAEVVGGAAGVELVDPDDGMELTSAVDRLLASPPESALIAQEVRGRTASWAEVTDSLVGHYQDALGLAAERGRPPGPAESSRRSGFGPSARRTDL